MPRVTNGSTASNASNVRCVRVSDGETVPHFWPVLPEVEILLSQGCARSAGTFIRSNVGIMHPCDAVR